MFNINMLLYYLYFLVLLTLYINCDNLGGFRFHPTKNSSCYQIYNAADNVGSSTCKLPQKESKRTCVKAIPNDKRNCAIFSPTREMIIVPCRTQKFLVEDSPNFDTSYSFSSLEYECYKVLKNNTEHKLCPTVIDEESIGLVTPDNFTLLIHSNECDPLKNAIDILADLNFALNFTFDYETKYCYQVYTSDQYISSYTCSDNVYIKMVCVEKWEKDPDCLVLKIGNDETVILGCKGLKKLKENIVQVHKSGEIKEVGVQQLEEGCVGVVTPSGLRVLFVCRRCYKDRMVTKYDSKMFKRQFNFVRNYFDNEISKKSTYFRNKYEVIKNYNEFDKSSFYSYWFPNSNCYGLNLDNNETVTLICTDKEFDEKGCFKVKMLNQEGETDVCATVYDERCIVIPTPSGKQIILTCYDDEKFLKKMYPENEIRKVKTGNYHFNSFFRLYKNKCSSDEQIVNLGWLYGHNCWGVVTEDLETILLRCPEKIVETNPGCFKIYSQVYGFNNEIENPSQKELEVCVEILDDSCIGLVTPKGWRLELKCYETFGGLGGGVFNPKPQEPTDMI